jgi:hypothetical protein
MEMLNDVKHPTYLHVTADALASAARVRGTDARLAIG